MNSLCAVRLVLFCAAIVISAAGSAFANDLPLPLTLTEAVKLALERNPEIQQLQHRFRATEAKAKQAPYLEDPQIALQLNGVPLSNPTSLNQSDWNSIGIRQMLPFFGKLGLKEKIAQREAKMAEQDLRAKEREISSMVKVSYAELFMASRSVEILREQLEILRIVIDATESRYRVGRVTQQDVLKAQLEQSEVLNQLILAEEEIAVATVRLNTAMYQPPRTPVQIPGDVEADTAVVNVSGLDDIEIGRAHV